MKDQRIPFSDYTPEEQERDIEKFKQLEKKYQPHAFLLKVDGVWAHLTIAGGLKHKFYKSKTLIETYQELRLTHPNHKVKYIINKGLEDYLRVQWQKEQAAKRLQLNINFSKER